MKYVFLAIVLIAWIVFYFRFRKEDQISIPIASILGVISLIAIVIAFKSGPDQSFISSKATLNASIAHAMASEMAAALPEGGKVAVYQMAANSDSWKLVQQETLDGIRLALEGKPWTIEEIAISNQREELILERADDSAQAKISDGGAVAALSFVGFPKREANDGIKFAACVVQTADNPAVWQKKLKRGELQAVVKRKPKQETSTFSESDPITTIFSSVYELVTAENL